MADFHQRLIELRKEKGLSQYAFAEIVNSTRSTISGYETEGKEPSFAQLIVFAEFFGVSIDYLLGYSNQRWYNDKAASGDLILSAAEKRLINIYRQLSNKGIAYLEQQAEIASAMYNK